MLMRYMQGARALQAVLAISTLTIGLALAQSTPVALGSFDGCPPSGSGGDPALNMQKNRSTGPSSVTPFTVARLEQLPTVPSSDGKIRSGWPEALRSEIEDNENHGAVFTGYIVLAKAEGKESCNCELTSARDHDVHVYVADQPEQTVAESAIVEVSPRWRAVYPAWNASYLKQIAAAGTEVRITGWLLYDQEHWDMIHKHQRATLWELHPITRVQVRTADGWRDLAEST